MGLDNAFTLLFFLGYHMSGQHKRETVLLQFNYISNCTSVTVYIYFRLNVEDFFLFLLAKLWRAFLSRQSANSQSALGYVCAERFLNTVNPISLGRMCKILCVRKCFLDKECRLFVGLLRPTVLKDNRMYFCSFYEVPFLPTLLHGSWHLLQL
ncbi:hypothetical protein FKM82_003306 [Ascaphus truei]